jgi:hypothetical protein
MQHGGRPRSPGKSPPPSHVGSNLEEIEGKQEHPTVLAKPLANFRRLLLPPVDPLGIHNESSEKGSVKRENGNEYIGTRYSSENAQKILEREKVVRRFVCSEPKSRSSSIRRHRPPNVHRTSFPLMVSRSWCSQREGLQRLRYLCIQTSASTQEYQVSNDYDESAGRAACESAAYPSAAQSSCSRLLPAI